MIANPQTGFAMEDARLGKLGLALSGGGFRASLFHLGVLAKLADLDLLRHVATISTVSGGSIIGAFYQLKVKQLLEGRRGDRLAPSAQAFRQLVGEIERDFVQAIQHNLRICTFTDREKNARILSNSYSTTERLAELFETHFFAPITERDKTSLRDLTITPAFAAAPPGDPAAFQVPELVMNSTALNTGHLFQFTGQYVGEGPVDSVLGGIAPMSSLDRIYLQDPNLRRRQRARLDRITVGDAVAASSCVPGLLEPYKLTDLYQDEDGNDSTVRLVDGGVFDNQGLASLFEADCTHFICSDATDLLSWELDPSDRMHNVLMRTNDIMMDRVRAELMEELIARGSDRYAVFTLGDLDGPKVFSREAVRIVSALAHIRTDLDAFSDTEAAALMYYGFLLSGHTLRDGQTPDTRPAAVSTATTDERRPNIHSQSASETAPPHSWAFAWVSDALADPASRETLIKQLELGSHSLFKVFHMGKALPRVLAVAPLVVPIAMLAWVVSALPPVPAVAWLLIVLVALSALAYNQNTRLIRWLDQIDWLRRWRMRLTIALKPLGITVFLGLLLAAASRLYLRVFNRLFLRYGKPPGELS